MNKSGSCSRSARSFWCAIACSDIDSSLGASDDLHLMERLLFKVEMALTGWHMGVPLLVVLRTTPLSRAMATAVLGGETDAPNCPYDVACDGYGVAISTAKTVPSAIIIAALVEEVFFGISSWPSSLSSLIELDPDPESPFVFDDIGSLDPEPSCPRSIPAVRLGGNSEQRRAYFHDRI